MGYKLRYILWIVGNPPPWLYHPEKPSSHILYDTLGFVASAAPAAAFQEPSSADAP